MKTNPLLILSVCIFFMFTSGYSQKASFTADVNAGCSPLVVTFKNTSTGFSPTAIYNFNFGEGGGSISFPLAPHIYITEKTYTAKLIITDNGISDTATIPITVYAKPQVDFSANLAEVCAKKEVLYTSQSTPGDGEITKYLWDFGDGNIADTTSNQISHIYQSAHNVTVGLTVTNNHGCYNSFTKNNLVTILSAPKVSFAASQTSVCNTSDAITFTNQTAEGIVPNTYSWDFGDGNTSTNTNESHVYGVKGNFGVRLMATNSIGCTDTTESTIITVANSKTIISTPSLFCQNTNLIFKDSSKPLTNHPIWMLDNKIVSTDSHQYITSISDMANHTLQLINEYGGCNDTATQIIQAKSSPIATPFTTNLSGICNLPIVATFNDTTASITKWEWDFNNLVDSLFNPSAFTKTSSYSYKAENTYNVKLRVTNADGCSASIRQPITIRKNKTTITSSEGVYGCKSLLTTFKASSLSPILDYSWTFPDDNSTSQLPSPEHSFSTKGTYTVLLKTKTTSGCNDTASLKIKIADAPADFDFSATPGTTVCGNTKVTFTVTGDPDKTTGLYYWNFGDTRTYSLLNGSTCTHQYSSDSVYTVSLIINNHGCTDTVTKMGYMTVLSSFTKINSVVNNCDDRLKVTFTQNTKKAQTYYWNFGDDSSPLVYDSTHALTEVSHTFPSTGYYKVTLTTTYGNCVAKDSVTPRVLAKQKPAISALQNILCTSDSLQTTVSGMDNNPYGTGYKYTVKGINYKDGSPFTGLYYYPDIYPVNPFHVTVKKLKRGADSLQFVLNSAVFNCLDTSNYIPIQVSGPTAKFGILDSSICLSDKLWLSDSSIGDANTPIATWKWYFGDSTSQISLSGIKASHRYKNPGTYTVKLVVTDEQKCSDSAFYSNKNITVKGPKARFSIQENPILPNKAETFTNLTDSGYEGRNKNSYRWIFGDGETVNNNADKISHTYKGYSENEVKLIVSNNESRCTDTASNIVHVNNTNLSYTYSTTYLNQNSTCPPVLVRFAKVSSVFDKVRWDFGDGLTADNISTPSHTYYNAGVYKVTIFGYYTDNTYDSTSDYVNIVGPTAVLHSDFAPTCGAADVIFSAETTNCTSLMWDFGDGTIATDSIVKHKYNTPNVYTPSLTVKNGTQCSVSYFLETPINIDSIHVGINHDSVMQCHQLLENFTPEVFSIAQNNGQPINYTWQFGAGNDTSKKDTVSHIFEVPGNYTVTLIAASPYGCSDTAAVQILYQPQNQITIEGPSDFCEKTPVAFTAKTNNNSDPLTYNWLFQNNTSSLQNPPAQLFDAKGSNVIRLVINNNNCSDTLYKTVIIRAQPDVVMLMSDSSVCLGNAIVFNALPANSTDTQPINYFWNLGVGDNKDTATIQSAAFVYPAQGLYPVTLEATSSYGCKEQLTATARIFPSPKASIAAPLTGCINGLISFRDTASSIENTKYVWHYPDNTTDTSKNPSPKRFNSAGVQTISLTATAGSCSDTTYHSITIRNNPIAGLSPTSPRICFGDSVQLNAHNGLTYEWMNTDAISNNKIANPVVFPVANTKFKVQVTDEYGCYSFDSVTVAVTQHQKVKATTPVNVCAGNKATLSVSGADRFTWINATDLTDLNSATPSTIDSAQNKQYTVIGKDEFGCFEDTANVQVIVKTKPDLRIGNTSVTPAGTPLQLSASSTDHITNWSWQPQTNLSCSNCAAPVTRLKQTTKYTVVATDDYGCKNSDTILVTVVCKGSIVSIPEAFTPNNDGLNDRFRITANGIKLFSHIVVYGRTGNKVFERNNVSPFDNNAAWDGMANNLYMPTGTYIYMVQAVCEAGDVINLQGTVSLIR